MAELVAKRYASALFEAGEDLDQVETFYKELKSLEEVIDKEEDLMIILSHPKVNKEEKKSLINKLFGDVVSQELINFLYILIDKNRQKNLKNIISLYEDLYYKYEDILRVTAITAVAMKLDAAEKLTDVLGEKLNKRIELTNKVEKDVIGGVKLELDGKLIDGTIRGKLDSMARAFNITTN